jgi:hypothetical protein
MTDSRNVSHRLMLEDSLLGNVDSSFCIYSSVLHFCTFTFEEEEKWNTQMILN